MASKNLFTLTGDDDEQEGKDDAPITGASKNLFDLPAIDSTRIRSAIKQTESGGDFNIKGASGETGAYQFMPSTWKQFSSEFNKGNGALEQTPETEEAVVEFKINQWISEGLGPEEIAAKWNSGSSKNWQNKRGTNKQGVKYDVPAYVTKVMGAYGSLPESAPVKEREPVELLPSHKSTPISRAKERARGNVYDAAKRQQIADDLGIDVEDIPAPVQALKDASDFIYDSAKGVKYSYDMADMGMAEGRIGSRMRRGVDTPEDARRLKELAEKKKAIQAEVEKSPFLAKSFGTLAPFLVNSAKKGGEGALIGGTVGAGVAFLAGQVVPGAALLPEEVLTAPALTALGSKIGASFASVNDIADIEAGSSYLEFINMGMDKEKAGLASDVIGLGSGMLELAQFKLLKRLLPGQDKLVSGVVGRAIKQVMQNNAATRAAAKFGGAIVPEASIETAQEFWKNVNELAARNLATELDQKDLSTGTIQEAQALLGKGLKETFVTTLAGFGVAAIPGAAVNFTSDVRSSSGADKSSAVKTSEGVTLVPAHDVATPDATDVTPGRTKPTVSTLMGEEKIQTEPKEDGEGKVVSNRLDVTDEQTKSQFDSNQSVKDIIEKVAVEKNQQKLAIDINSSESRLKNLEGFYEDALLDEDHEGALQVAEMMQDETTKLTQNYQALSMNHLKDLDNKKLLPDPDELTDIELHVQKINDRSNKAVAAQKTAVNNIRIQEQQNFIESLGTRKGLEADLQSQAVLSSRAGNSAQGKLYQNVLLEMKQQSHMGPSEYYSKTPAAKLLKMKLEIEQQEIVDRESAVGALEKDRAQIRTDAMKTWINDSLKDRAEYDDIQLFGERIIHDAKIEQKQAKEAAKAKADVSAKAKGAKDIKAVRRAQKGKLTGQRRKEQARVAEAAKKVKVGTRTVQDLRTQLRKPVPGPTRTEELETVKTDKAKRESEIKKQVERVEGLERPKTPIKKGKAKVSDLKKDTSNFVILTSDNPQSKQASPAVNVKNRQALKKKLDDLGIDYTIGKSKFEGLDEVPFVIHNMSQAEGKKLSDSLGQSSFIYGKGKEVGLVEGDKVAKGKRADTKLAPDATDYYTEINGEKFTMNFDFENQLDVDGMQMSEGVAGKARELFRAAAIQMPDGTVHEGTSHIDILDNSIGIENMIKMPMEQANKMKDGFVTVDGKFVERGTAAKMVGVRGDDTLYSETFLHKVADQRHDKNETMSVVNFKKMTLEGKMGTLEVMDSLEKEMKVGKYKFLFNKTKAHKIKTVFVTAEGQYSKIPEVKTQFSNLKSRENASSRFDGGRIVDPKTGQMVRQEGLKGVFHREQNLAVINLPAIGRTASNLDQALETVVHEHVHGLTKIGLETMGSKEKAALEKELKLLWQSLGTDFKRQLRDNPEVHPRIRMGIQQVDESIVELITYGLAHPEFAEWLDSIAASPRFKAKQSTIKTMWDAIKDLIIKAVAKVPSKHDELMDILNTHMGITDGIPQQIRSAGVRVSDFAQDWLAKRNMLDDVADGTLENWGVRRDDIADKAFSKGIELEIEEYEDTLFVHQLTIPPGKQSAAVGTLRALAKESKELGKPVSAQIVNNELLAGLEGKATKGKLRLKADDVDLTTVIRFSKVEDLTQFNFGNNVTPRVVAEWIAEIDAPNAAQSIVVKDAAEFEEQFGFAPGEKAVAVWLDSQKGRKKAVKGTTAIPALPAIPQQVVFISDRIQSQEDFVFRFMHEQAGHVGLRNLFGKNKALMNRFFDQAYSIFASKDAELLQQTIETYDIGRVTDPNKGIRKLTGAEKRLAAEEVLATKAAMLKPTTKKSLAKRFKEFLQRWLPSKFVARVNTFKMTEADLTMVMEAARESVFVRQPQIADMISKALESRRPEHKFKGWDKLPNFMESDDTYKAWAKEVAEAVPEAKEWYEQHVNLMRENFGKDADMLSVLLALTSPQADVETNVQFAIDTYLYLLGKNDKPGHRFPKKFEAEILSQWTDAKGMLKSIESSNFKVTEFLRSLMGDTNGTVGDIWMYRAFFGDHVVHNQADENPRVSQQVALRQKLFDLADELTTETGTSWHPRDLQAAIWVYVNAKTTGKPFEKIASFKSGFNKPTPKYDGKTPLEHLNTVVPDVAEGPLSQKLGLEGIEQSPLSTLEKKRLLALSREGVKAKYPVKEDGTIRALGQDTSPVANVRMIDAIAKGGTHVTAVSQEMADHYKEVFGFEPVDGLDMKLSDTALALYTNNKGKVTANSVRDNLGGFANENFSRTARFSLEARKNLDHIAAMSQEDIIKRDEELLATGNDGSSVLGKLFEWSDQMLLNMNRFTDQLEQEFLNKFGGRKTRTPVRVLGFASGKKLNTYDTELLQKAMNLYIDSGSGKNLEKVMAYVKKLGARGIKKLSVRELDQLEQIERMLALTEEEKAWADSEIRPYYEDFFDFAQDKEIIDSHVDNYVKRTWKMPKSLDDSTVTWSGSGTTGFKLKAPSGEQRVLESIVDGWEAGMDLKVQSVLQNLSNYGTEVGKVYTNRRFVEYMRGLISFNQGGLMHEVDVKQDPTFKPPKHYSQVVTQGFAKPFHKLYARNDIAGILNNLTKDPGSQHWTAQLVRRLNSTIKSVILNVSLFHHLAGMRSYVFGVGGKHFGQWNPIKAYKRGLKLIDEQVGLDGQYRSIGPVVDYLVREGLTIGKTQDWEDMGGVGWIEEALLKMQGPKAQSALSKWRLAGRFRRGMTTGLFNRLFAGLKAEAGSIEFVHKINQKEKKLGRPLTDAELKTTAQQVAALVNADFGGLHHGRLNRSHKLQRALQLFLLAPDWTESNWRTVVEAIPGANKVPDIIRKTFTDAPAEPKNLMPEGMESVYRKFWWGVAKRGVLSVAMLQAGIMAFADDDEREDYWDHFKQQFSSLSQFSKGRWTEVDFTPIARRMGVGDPDKRQTFSVIGHFKDIIKVFSPSSLIKHKMSPAVRVGETMLLKTDWKGDEFSSFAEFLETGSMTKAQFDSQPSTFWEQAPVIALYNVRSSFPIFLSEGLRSLSGETTYLTGVSKALGMDVKDTRSVSAGQRKYEEVNSEINELERNLKDAQTVKDRRMIVEARKDIKRYEGFNRKKSRIGFTKVQLRQPNKDIKRLNLIAETRELTTSEQRKLDRAKAKRDKIYSKFLKVIER